MHYVKTLEKGIVFDHANRIFSYNGWPTVGKLDDGTIVMVASGLRNWHVDPFAKVIMCQSRDEGKTWSPPTILMDTILDNRDSGFLNLGNGRVLVTSFTGNLVGNLNHLDSHSEYLKSFDKLIRAYVEMVTPEEDAAGLFSCYRISDDSGFTWGEMKTIPVTCPHGPALLKDGRILYVGNRMGAEAMKAMPPKYELEVYESRDRGDSFAKYSEIPTPSYEGYKLNYCEPHMIEMKNGDLLCHIRLDVLSRPQKETGKIPPICQNRSTDVYQSRSTDGGKTWSMAEPLLTEGSPPHLLQHSSGLLISAYANRSDPFAIMVALSADNGVTWEKDKVIDDTPTNWDMGYASTVELGNGDLFSVYYSRRPENTSSPVRWIRWSLK